MKKFIIVLVGLCLFKCDSATYEPSSDAQLNQETDEVLTYIQSLGFKTADTKDMGNYYLVQGDIRFSKDLSFKETASTGRTKQYSTGRLLDAANQPNIRILIDGSLSTMSSEITTAIALWNGVTDSYVRFSIVTSGSYDIYMYDTYMYGACGAADFAYDGHAGPTVMIDEYFISVILGLSSSQKVSLVAHELGHAIGFRHTNWLDLSEPEDAYYNGLWYSAVHIPGTPTDNDSQSIMNGATCGTAPTSLSTNDALAVATLYPACGTSSWSLSPTSSDYITSGTTRNYIVAENGPRTLVTSTSPTMGVFAYASLNVVYNGTTYTVPAYTTVYIPIASSSNCTSNPSISAPLTFNNTSGTLNSVMVWIHSVSGNHTFSSGYHSIYIY